MTKYTFTGGYPTDVQLPDLSVVRVEPGETVELEFDEPGPLWAGSRTNLAKAAVASVTVPVVPADKETV